MRGGVVRRIHYVTTADWFTVKRDSEGTMLDDDDWECVVDDMAKFFVEHAYDAAQTQPLAIEAAETFKALDGDGPHDSDRGTIESHRSASAG
jgi:hypothetical protein